MTAEFSILGMYNYDASIFANMAYPTGFTSQDKTDFVDNLLMELAELEVIYPDPVFFKMAVEKWSKKEVVTWDRIYSASLLDYNPIENYDRQESESEVTDGTRQHSGTDTVTNSGTDTTTNSGTDTVTNSGKDTTQDSGTDSSSGNGSKGTTRTGSDTTTNKIAGYDSGTLVTHDTSELAFASGVSETTTDSTTVTHGKKSELTHGHVEATQHGHVEALQHGLQSATLHGEKIEDDISRSKMSRIHGNIGVTTSQQMLQQEIDIAPKLNIMNYMIESFKNRFCILVY